MLVWTAFGAIAFGLGMIKLNKEQPGDSGEDKMEKGLVQLFGGMMIAAGIGTLVVMTILNAWS